MSHEPVSNKKIIYSAVVLLLVLGAVLLFTRKRPVTADWMVITEQEAQETVLASGRVAGSKLTPLSLLKNGTVRELPVAEGTSVEKGDTLCVFDNREEANRVAQKKNSLTVAALNLQRLKTVEYQQAEERLKQAMIRETTDLTRLKRSDTLFLQGSITGEMYDETRATAAINSSRRQSAENELASITSTAIPLEEARWRDAKLQLQEAEIALSRTILRAPSSGEVVDILIEAGETVSPGTALVLFLPEDTAQYIELQVDENEIATIKPGQPALIRTIGNRPVTMDASVSRVVERIDIERGTGTVFLSILSPEHTLIADQTVTAQIITGVKKKALIGEQRFLGTDGEGSYAFIIEKKNARKKKVIITPIGNGLCVIEKGLSAGDTIITATTLADRAPVVLIEKRPGNR